MNDCGQLEAKDRQMKPDHAVGIIQYARAPGSHTAWAMSESTHYLFITIGTTGDVHPFLYLARGMHTAGRRVSVITHSYHAALVRAAGLPFIGLGNDEEYLQLLANPDLWDSKKSFSALMADYSDRLEQIDAAIRSSGTGPKVVVCHPFVVPAATISREQGAVLAVVAAYLAPANLKTCHDPLTIGDSTIPRWVPLGMRRALWWLVEKRWIDPVAVRQINVLRTRRALPPVHSLLGHVAQSPDLALTLFPTWFAPGQPDWPQPMVCGNFPLFEAHTQAGLAAELSEFLAQGAQPVVFTAGTGNLHASHFFACALAAVRQLGCRAIFLARDRGQVPFDLPATVLWQAYVPLAALLPRAASLVHHGGIGTTSEALRAGTPQLVVPFAWDQFDNGARIAALGVGTVLPAARLQGQALATRLAQMRDSATLLRERCNAVAAHFHQPNDPVVLCMAMEEALDSKEHEKGRPMPKTRTAVHLCDLPPGTVIADRVQGATFHDSYATPLRDEDLPVPAAELALRIFLRVPAWVERLMRIRNRVVGWFGLKNQGSFTQGVDRAKPASAYRVGERVGLFTVMHIDRDEFIMGDDDRHLQVQISVRKARMDGRMHLVLSTVVHEHNWLGRIYMLFVGPAHRIIAPATLRNGY